METTAKKPKPKKGKALPTGKHQIQAQESESKAMALRIQGYTLREIGAAMGFSEQYAHELVTRAIERYREKYAEQAAQVLDLELARLDKMLVKMLKMTLDGDTEAAKIVLKIMERRARYLGLDMPKSVTLSSPDGSMGGPVTITIEAVESKPVEDET